ncbi:hypothetical protein DITRI_Ditri03aG0087700 [Diplodiscus trichospermus]
MFFPASSVVNSRQCVIWISAFALLACFSVHAQITQKSQKWLGAAPQPSKSEDHLNVKRSDFPSDFVFGTSTSAAQTEGSTKSGGKGPSVWDQFVRNFPGKIMDKSNLEVAIDSYNRYKEDELALRDLGVDAYRFSIPWTRILPNGTLSGGINQEGINHYNSLIDQLVKHGIKPFVTLMHFDSPEALEIKYGGFLNRSIVKDFTNYAEICFRTFGDRVKNWITINEANVIAKFGYTTGIAPPGRCSDRTTCPAGNAATEPYIVAHNILLAHASAARLYKEKYQAAQGGQIGISHVGQYYEPYSDTLLDRIAAKRAMDFELGWFMEPLLLGRYPLSMRRLVKDRLPVFTEKERILVKGSFDFIGINYYTARYAKNIPVNPKAAPVSFLADEHVNSTVAKNGFLIGPQADGSWYLYIYPKGLYKILKFIKRHYSKNLTIYITENGITEKRNDGIPIHQVLDDQHRIEFIQKHLLQIRKAINHGVNVKGYFYWNLFDDFEWSEGFSNRFGLYYIDFKNNLKRIPKKSAKWYHDFVRVTQASQKGIGAPISNSKEYLNVEIRFSKWFICGVSTAAARIVESAKSGEKGPSAWDQFVQKLPDKIMDKGTLEVAIDSYTKRKDFKNYAELCFKTFGDRVKTGLQSMNHKLLPNWGLVSESLHRANVSDRAKCPSGNAATESYIAAVSPATAPLSYLVDQYVSSADFTEQKKNDKILISQALNDQNRLEFVQKHLHHLCRAINNGTNVKGYFFWRLFNDFEWSESFAVRYGLYYVDFKNLKRIPKRSAKWYHDFVRK